MATRSFILQYEKTFGPEPSLVPLFVEALETGQRGGSGSLDVFKTTLLASSPRLVEQILDGRYKTSRASRNRGAAPLPQVGRALKDGQSFLYEASRAVWADVATGCCRRSLPDELPARPRYGLRLSQIRCRDKDEVGHDEVYACRLPWTGRALSRATPVLRTRLMTNEPN